MTAEEDMSDLVNTITQSETLTLGAGTITFDVLGRDARHHELSITCAANGSLATVTVDQDVIEELHRAYCRAVHLVRLEARGVWEIREKHPSAFYPWTEHEEEGLVARFRRGIPLTELAKDFGRSEPAIRARLIKLGFHPDRQRKRRQRQPRAVGRQPPPAAHTPQRSHTFEPFDTQDVFSDFPGF